MKKNDLQAKLNELLIGTSAYNMYQVCDKVAKNLGSWFDDYQGKYYTRLDYYTITITYKGRGILSFTVIRKKDVDGNYIIKRAEINDDFIDTEELVSKVREKFKEENKDDWRWQGDEDLSTLTEMLALIKEKYPTMTDKDIRRAIRSLSDYYWNVEENLNESKGWHL